MIIADTAPTSIEICAGAGGSALGLEQAGFRHMALVELDPWACATLRSNRRWRDLVVEADVAEWSPGSVVANGDRIDLLSGGVPCPPFSVAGKQLGRADERDLFPAMLDLAADLAPSAIMIENVKGLLSSAFNDYRLQLDARFADLGYRSGWALLNASDYGVPQLRPRVVIVALTPEFADLFTWPDPIPMRTSVGRRLRAEMASNGWDGASAWAAQARTIAPTLVGGSKKHGGPDLGPSRAREAWRRLGVDGGTLAEDPPSADHVGMPRLTVRMAARIQGFPAAWRFSGSKTHAYRQVGNAFPPPVARAVGKQIATALLGEQCAGTYDLASHPTKPKNHPQLPLLQAG